MTSPSRPPAASLAAVVLAGGRSSRFGTDKLAADLDGTTLLDRVLAALPAGTDAVVVGPPRPTPRTVRFVREDPPDGGPAAALIAGLRVVDEASTVLVVPGDAPDSGRAAETLLAALGDADRAAVIALDDEGREQPLQLALRPGAVRELVTLAGPDGASNASARRLVLQLSDLTRCPLPCDLTRDIDTTDDLATYLRDRPRLS